jgi:hypothetical protein
LAHYAQINSTLAEELRAEGCEGLAGDKATLYSARSFSSSPLSGNCFLYVYQFIRT